MNRWRDAIRFGEGVADFRLQLIHGIEGQIDEHIENALVLFWRQGHGLPVILNHRSPYRHRRAELLAIGAETFAWTLTEDLTSTGATAKSPWKRKSISAFPLSAAYNR